MAKQFRGLALEVCNSCSGSGRVLVSSDGSLSSSACTDCDAGSSRLIAAAGIPPRHMDSTFDSFDASGNAALSAALECCTSFPEPNDWVVLSGPPGVGKTHLLVSILRRHIICGGSGAYISFERLFSMGRDSFGGDGDGAVRRAKRAAMSAHLVCLDELGSGRATDYEIGMTQEIINTRYADRLPTVFATNYRVSGTPHSLEGSGRVGAQSISRIVGCSKVIEIDSRDWRKHGR